MKTTPEYLNADRQPDPSSAPGAVAFYPSSLPTKTPPPPSEEVSQAAVALGVAILGALVLSFLLVIGAIIAHFSQPEIVPAPSNMEIGEFYDVTMPDGEVISDARYRGSIRDKTDLPPTARLKDEYWVETGGHYGLWLRRGAGAAGWILNLSPTHGKSIMTMELEELVQSLRTKARLRRFGTLAEVTRRGVVHTLRLSFTENFEGIEVAHVSCDLLREDTGVEISWTGSFRIGSKPEEMPELPLELSLQDQGSSRWVQAENWDISSEEQRVWFEFQWKRAVGAPIEHYVLHNDPYGFDS